MDENEAVDNINTNKIYDTDVYKHLGRKSFPTKASRTDDLPALWPPTVAIRGSPILTRELLNTFWRLFTMSIRSVIPDADGGVLSHSIVTQLERGLCYRLL